RGLRPLPGPAHVAPRAVTRERAELFFEAVVVARVLDRLATIQLVDEAFDLGDVLREPTALVERRIPLFAEIAKAKDDGVELRLAREWVAAPGMVEVALLDEIA